MISSEKSREIYVHKALSIISVICAHMALVIEEGESGWLANKLIAVYGTLGVAAFFFYVGYFYHREKGDTIRFWTKKVKFLVIPWIIWSIITKLLDNFLDMYKFSLQGIVGWTMGHYTWLYFIPVSLVAMVLLKFYRNNWYLLALIIVSIYSDIVTIIKNGDQGGVHNDALSESI